MPEWIQNIDDQVLHWFQGHRTPWLNYNFQQVTALGSTTSTCSPLDSCSWKSSVWILSTTTLRSGGSTVLLNSRLIPLQKSVFKPPQPPLSI